MDRKELVPMEQGKEEGKHWELTIEPYHGIYVCFHTATTNKPELSPVAFMVPGDTKRYDS